MTQKHTPEPWVQCSGDFVAAESDQLNNGEYILSSFGPDQAANARRIVACVNALQGASTSELEEAAALGIKDVRIGNLFSSRMDLQRQLADMTAQRDELLAALEAAVECGMVPASSATEGGAMRYVRQAHVSDQIRAAIDQAKGGSVITKITGETK